MFFLYRDILDYSRLFSEISDDFKEAFVKQMNNKAYLPEENIII